jgi:hypothetical protein
VIDEERSQAVKSAGDRLEAIERWSRRTFYATVVGACFLGILASATVYGGYVYVRLTMAVGEASAEFSRSMEEARARMAHPTPPRIRPDVPRKKGGT